MRGFYKKDAAPKEEEIYTGAPKADIRPEDLEGMKIGEVPGGVVSEKRPGQEDLDIFKDEA